MSVYDIQVVVFQISKSVLLCVCLQKMLAVLEAHFSYTLVLLPVHVVGLAAVAYLHDALASKRKFGVVQGSYLDVLGRSDPLVDVVDAKEFGLLAILLVDKVAGFDILVDELVAPPSTPTVLRHHVAVVLATEVQVFQGERLFAFLGGYHRK